MNIKMIRPFVPSINFEESITFYRELGFVELWKSNDLCMLGSKEHNFFVQKYYSKEFAENFMLQLFVDDLDDLYQIAESLIAKYRNTKIKPIFTADYGRTFHLIGPAGELWHMTEVKKD